MCFRPPSAVKAKICPSCGASNPELMKKCLKCKEPLPETAPEPVTCPRCGAENAADAKACSACGLTTAQAMTALKKPVICPECKKINQPMSKRCVDCDAELNPFA